MKEKIKINLSGTSPVDSKAETHWVSIPGIWIEALELITAYLMMIQNV
jgi:hypothetical protein